MKFQNSMLLTAAFAGISTVPAFGAIVITNNFSFAPTTRGQNTPTIVYLPGATIGDNTMDLVDFKFDTRGDGAFIWNGSQQQSRDAAFNQFGTNLAAPPHTIGIALNAGSAFGNGLVVGLNFMTFLDSDPNYLGAGSEMVLGFEIEDVDTSGGWSDGDLITFLGVAYDDALPTDGSSEVLVEADVRAAFAAVPEPSTGLLTLSALGFGLLRRRR